jgi:hypothetical protein
MKTFTFILMMLLCFGLMVNSGIYTGYVKTEKPQPSPLILDKDSMFIIQPIVENIDLKGYEYIMTFKLYYKDKMTKAIDLKKGPPINGYCSDITIVKFYLTNSDSIEITSIKRLSCQILAIFNMDVNQNKKLKIYPIDSIKITNYVTNNEYKFQFSDKNYFLRLINQYPHWN